MNKGEIDMLIQKKGFTLVELLLVLVILGILASIGYPSYLRFMRASGAESAKAVIDAIVAAEKIIRERTGSCVPGSPAGWVSIDVGNGIYTVGTEQIDTGEAPDFEFLIDNVWQDGCTITARGKGGLFTSAVTLICVYDATANPRQTWSGTLYEE